MALTTDPNDPRLKEPAEIGQNDVYLVMTEEQRKQGFTRPYRDTYVHVTCKTTTTMGREIAETYARNPAFYGRTYCVHCGKHYPVGEFKWLDGETVGS